MSENKAVPRSWGGGGRGHSDGHGSGHVPPTPEDLADTGALVLRQGWSRALGSPGRPPAPSGTNCSHGEDPEALQNL